ncbi:MAG: hypothetical protein ACPGQL_03360 [Thermoplasmatota archaeon]
MGPDETNPGSIDTTEDGPETLEPMQEWFDENPNSSWDVLLLRDYATGNEGTNGGEWDELIRGYKDWGWTGNLRIVALHQCDNAFNVLDLHSHGSHSVLSDSVRYHADESAACGKAGHTRDTDIRHLAYHLAEAIHTEYGSGKRCVVAIGHGMGGIILRTMATMIEQAVDGLPSEVCLKVVVLMGTPNEGTDVLNYCESWKFSCEQLRPRSRLMDWLEEEGQNPQTLGGTRWIAVASHRDEKVDFESVFSMQGAERVLYHEENKLSHDLEPNYITAIRPIRDAVVTFAQSGGSQDYSTASPWSVEWSFLAFQNDMMDWIRPDVNLGPDLELVEPTAGTYVREDQVEFQVKVSCGADPEGDATTIEFLHDGQVVHSERDLVAAANRFAFQVEAPGYYRFAARCLDPHGASGEHGVAQWDVEFR